MAYGLIKYDWSVQVKPDATVFSNKAYITKEDNIFSNCVLYYLYASNGDFISMYWSESEARIAAAAQGLECEEKLRDATMSLPRLLDFETMQGLIL